MSGRGFRTGLVALASAGLLAATSVLGPPPAQAANLGIIVGGTGTPIPGPDYTGPAYNLYLKTPCGGCAFEPLYTPAQLYPIYTPPGATSSAVKQLPFDLSVDQGRRIMVSEIEKQVAAGNSVWIYGESQSATISSLVMKNLQADNVPTDKVNFVLVGDPDLPNGGTLARYPGLTLPSLGITFYGATPDNPYPTTIYTQEYDGFADVPEYPINFLSDLNAFLGFYYVHPTYGDLTPEQLANAITLPTQGTTSTTYYMIPTANLPLLEPLRGLPFIGTPLADLVQPALRVLVNLGYGSIENGWSPGPANVPTPIGLFPSNIALGDVVNALVAGAQEGWQAFVRDITNPTSSTPTPPSPSPVPVVTPQPTPLDVINKLVNTVTDVASLGYSTLLPVADIANAVLTTLPLYDVNLSVQNLQKGKLIDAIGLPIAANTYLLTLAAGFGAVAVLNQIGAIGADVSDLVGTFTRALGFPAAASAPTVSSAAATTIGGQTNVAAATRPAPLTGRVRAAAEVAAPRHRAPVRAAAAIAAAAPQDGTQATEPVVPSAHSATPKAHAAATRPHRTAAVHTRATTGGQ